MADQSPSSSWTTALCERERPAARSLNDFSRWSSAIVSSSSEVESRSREPVGLYPSPPTSKVSANVANAFTVIWFVVNVPVLSEQITVVEPSVSTAFICRMMARCRAMFRMPRDNVITRMIGSPSGTMATKMAMATMNWSTTTEKRSPCPSMIALPSSTPTMTTATSRAINPRNRPKDSSFNSSGVFGGSASWMSVAIRPSWVSIPMLTTSP